MLCTIHPRGVLRCTLTLFGSHNTLAVVRVRSREGLRNRHGAPWSRVWQKEGKKAKPAVVASEAAANARGT